MRGISGVGKATLIGAANGAEDGFMSGGIAAGVTFTTVALKGVRIQEIGGLKPADKKGNGYPGVKFKNKLKNLKSYELHFPYKGSPHQQWHWQKSLWSKTTGKLTGKSKYWTPFGRRF